ncbi:hypothetical protein NDU88_005901 [Pleurodeles waltl]|uniref:Uncharacterized protein n=1 Tax=Pleurodeles waltl TaxID=8319 RepID=A0AAV7VKF3_PLEWA|nr:hypothetical protein NDU88_005901 [Pleurodeles waltl]
MGPCGAHHLDCGLTPLRELCCSREETTGSGGPVRGSREERGVMATARSKKDRSVKDILIKPTKGCTTLPYRHAYLIGRIMASNSGGEKGGACGCPSAHNIVPVPSK